MIILYNLLEIIVVIVPILLSVAFMTVVERKILASIQRRVGPNAVGPFGILQPFSDALKLVVKEIVLPSQATLVLFIIAPLLSLVFSILGWGVISFGPGQTLADIELGLLYSLAVSSVGVYGILLAGWSANSKYAYLGSLRSSAQIVSYELIFSSAVIPVVILAGTFNFTKITETQSSIWYIVPLFPIFVLFLISILAETNRTPFDNTEAESELTAGFFTEHSGMPFVLFFLAEYCSIVLISTLLATIFLGGYGFPEIITNYSFLSISAGILALKTCFGAFFFVWTRATFPRIKWTDLIMFCWSSLLPLSIAFVLLIPSILYAFNAL